MSRLTDVFTLFSGFLVVFGPKEVTMALPAAIHQSLLTDGEIHTQKGRSMMSGPEEMQKETTSFLNPRHKRSSSNTVERRLRVVPSTSFEFPCNCQSGDCSWYRNGRNLRNKNKRNVYSTDELKLTIKNVTKKTSGTYECREGEDNIKTRLIIEGNLSILYYDLRAKNHIYL
jgi:hypothetical protein